MRLPYRIDTALYEMRKKREVNKYKKMYPDYEDDVYNDGSLKFIWGVKSWDDLSGAEPSLYTMNDLDVTYDRDTKKYYLGIETIYAFEDEETGPKEYLKMLLREFTGWMESEGRDINYPLNLYWVFTDGNNINSGFECVEEAYTAFKLLVTGFCSMSTTD